jgi:hypothetical protein
MVDLGHPLAELLLAKSGQSGQTEAFGGGSYVFKELVGGLARHHEEVAVEVGQDYSEYLRRAVGQMDEHPPLRLIVTLEEIHEVMAKRAQQLPAAGENILSIQHDFQVHLPVLLQNTHILPELEILQTHKARIASLLKGNIGGLDEGMHQHGASLVLLAWHHLELLNVGGLKRQRAPALVESAKDELELLREVLTIDGLQEKHHPLLRLEVFPQKSRVHGEAVATGIEHVLAGLSDDDLSFSGQPSRAPALLVEVDVEEIVKISAVEPSEEHQRTTDEASSVSPPGLRLKDRLDRSDLPGLQIDG